MGMYFRQIGFYLLISGLSKKIDLIPADQTDFEQIANRALYNL